MSEERIKKYTIDQNETTYNALIKIENNSSGTLVVMNKNIVLGILTDGDIRKLLIAHNRLTVPVKYGMNRNFIFVLDSNDEQGNNSIFEEHPTIRLFPKVNKEGKLVDILIRPGFWMNWSSMKLDLFNEWDINTFFRN